MACVSRASLAMALLQKGRLIQKWASCSKSLLEARDVKVLALSIKRDAFGSERYKASGELFAVNPQRVLLSRQRTFGPQFPKKLPMLRQVSP
jgi:hypothetical protein